MISPTKKIEEVAAISTATKIPEFWKEQPRYWFIQFESIITPQKLSDEAKYHLVISKLGQDEIQQVGVIICSPPETEKYGTLKDKLTKCYEESEQKRFQRLLTETDIGDLKPSQLLRKMKDLARGSMGDHTVKLLWLRQLPHTITTVLAVMKDKTLDELSELADQIYETSQTAQISAISPCTQNQLGGNDLVACITELAAEVAEMRIQRNRRQNNYQQYRKNVSSQRLYNNNARSRSRDRLYMQNGPVCSYHRQLHSTKMRATMQVEQEASGKRRSAHMAAGIGAVFPSNRLSVIDTGDNISVLPKSTRNSYTKSEIKLYAANGTSINTFREKTLTLNLGLRRPFRWTFVIADVKTPILGADFLEYYKLLIDVYGKKLIYTQTQLSINTRTAAWDQPTVRTINANNHVKDLLDKYESITRSRPLSVQENHQVKHYIETKGQPVPRKARPLPPDKYLMAKKEFQEIINGGICRPSNSPWASPLHMVKKKNGEWRPCGVYRRLNDITVPDRYPVPRLEDVAYLLEGKRIF